MEEELDKIPIQEKVEYEEALLRAPELVHSESGFIKFLRKHNFNAEKSAQDLVSYWEIRKTFFGDEKAFLPMTIRGAMKDDVGALETGFIQILGSDEYGRAVVYHERSKAGSSYHRDSLTRVCFYISHIVSMDEQYQKKGYVIIVNTRSNTKMYFDRIYTKNGTRLGAIVPLKIKSFHYSSAEKNFMPSQILIPVVMYALNKAFRLRLKWFHCVEDLEDCGIPRELIPLSAGGTRNTDFCMWLEQQMMREQLELG